ncbi:crotonobetainyl-CoA:carnitine CoA-transferase CaiB-like acyl-CoA transferase [Streptosporangium album]|uniref:Crotonobetainyl-CoA:carnitine CoA-transferase CaiB-like acyl-CoA transferase n=1 Tax=Streptosporangium album TaxID=47479 RepID=A0A7W7S640_9ACTN|nr:CoA transferase [Streptosporangium album]MBB4944167.1 crotonobetainyl-CoA:carnitine CoA-transferase CaiB-like acyl-CoA transferase [Streptosporangium album]
MADDSIRDWARSGAVTLTGRADGPPLVPPGRAATTARELSERFAELTSVRLDGARLLSERAAYTGHRRRGAVSAGGSCRLLPTADGWAAVSCARPDDPALLGALTRTEVGDDPWPAVTRWLREHTGAEFAEYAGLLGIAGGPVRQHRNPCPLPKPMAPRPPAGLLVVDFSALWAGPLCAHLLSLAGARVVKVETPERPDGARRGNAEFYRLLHAGHRSVVLDPGDPRGRHALARLVDAADIVIEASRPRALAGFGLDADAAVAAGATWVSITAYGRARDRVGFGDDIAAASGLVAWDTDGTPLFCGDAIADPLTGLTAAVLAATAPADGSGMLWDVSMSDVVASALEPGVGPAAGTPGTRSLAARRRNGAWSVETPAGLVPVASPRQREVSDSGRVARSGEHTAEVLRELGIAVP